MRITPYVMAFTALSACSGGIEEAFTSVISPVEVPVQVSRGIGPPNADPDACYGRQVTPAIIETVTEHVMMQPPQIETSGAVREPAVFITETRQQIVRERRELWFETPCNMENDPEFVAALQRALSARGLLRGAVTGVLDQRTRRAILRYQEPQGLDSSILSLAAARQLGLAVWDPALAARPGTGNDAQPPL